MKLVHARVSSSPGRARSWPPVSGGRFHAQFHLVESLVVLFLEILKSRQQAVHGLCGIRNLGGTGKHCLGVPFKHSVAVRSLSTSAATASASTPASWTAAALKPCATISRATDFGTPPAR